MTRLCATIILAGNDGQPLPHWCASDCAAANPLSLEPDMRCHTRVWRRRVHPVPLESQRRGTEISPRSEIALTTAPRPLYVSYASPDGGIGRRAGFRYQW